MSETNIPETKKEKKSQAFKVLLALTFAYIAIFYFLLIETKICTDGTVISANWFKGFFDRYLGCIGINELGDSLAGAFAPVAFLWLAGAVYIQSQELKAQREELNETQEVMRAQLNVAEQQVEETKASTNLFREQTEILKHEQKLRDQKEADHEFDTKIAAAMDMCRDIDSMIIIQEKNLKNKIHIHYLDDEDSTIFNFSRTNITTFRELLKIIYSGSINAISTIELTSIKDGYYWALAKSNDAKALSDCLEDLSHSQKPLSAAYQFKKSAMQIDETYWKFKELERLITRKKVASESKKK